MTSRTVIRFGGFCLTGGAIAFLGVFTYLAARFDYPAVLDGPAATVLPSLLATGQQGRFVWAVYALLPLIWVPAGVAAYEALAPVRRGPMRLALPVPPMVAPIDALNNYLLPAFMIILGVALMRSPAVSDSRAPQLL